MTDEYKAVWTSKDGTKTDVTDLIDWEVVEKLFAKHLAKPDQDEIEGHAV